MANTTSGTTTFDKTFSIDEIIEEAYERIGRQGVSGNQLRMARRSLNIMFQEWANRGLHYWEVANATDVMVGSASFIDDTSDNMVGFETASTSDTITLNGSTTGGVTFAKIECTVLASGKWKVDVISGCTGSPATPFSAAVS